MTEWLTTGQMIDQLKVGENAKTVDRIKDEYIYKTENGYYWGDKEGNYVIGDSLIINDVVASLKWRILPKYVTFEEAMKALKEGKMINFHHENSRINAHKELHPVWFKNYQWNDLLEGKWTIEE